MPATVVIYNAFASWKRKKAVVQLFLCCFDGVYAVRTSQSNRRSELVEMTFGTELAFLKLP